MKRFAVYAAVSLFILLMTKVANQVPREPPSGTAFSLKAQKVVQCSPEEITLVDNHYSTIHLEKDSSWPECATFRTDTAFDFFLSQGEMTHFISDEETVWWRRAM